MNKCFKPLRLWLMCILVLAFISSSSIKSAPEIDQIEKLLKIQKEKSVQLLQNVTNLMTPEKETPSNKKQKEPQQPKNENENPAQILLNALNDKDPKNSFDAQLDENGKIHVKTDLRDSLGNKNYMITAINLSQYQHKQELFNEMGYTKQAPLLKTAQKVASDLCEKLNKIVPGRFEVPKDQTQIEIINGPKFTKQEKVALLQKIKLREEDYTHKDNLITDIQKFRPKEGEYFKN